MHKVVYNSCFGHFELNDEVVKWLRAHGYQGNPYHLKRHDPLLVQCVEELDFMADGDDTTLSIRELKGNKYRIEDCDGFEEVFEPEDYEWVEISNN